MAYNKTIQQNGDIITSQKMNNIEGGISNLSSSYERTMWENGDIITAEKLNNIEQCIENISNDNFVKVEWHTFASGGGNPIVFDYTTINDVGVLQGVVPFLPGYPPSSEESSKYTIFRLTVNGEQKQITSGIFGCKIEDSDLIYQIVGGNSSGFTVVIAKKDGTSIVQGDGISPSRYIDIEVGKVID